LFVKINFCFYIYITINYKSTKKKLKLKNGTSFSRLRTQDPQTPDNCTRLKFIIYLSFYLSLKKKRKKINKINLNNRTPVLFPFCFSCLLVFFFLIYIYLPPHKQLFFLTYAQRGKIKK